MKKGTRLKAETVEILRAVETDVADVMTTALEDAYAGLALADWCGTTLGRPLTASERQVLIMAMYSEWGRP
jgi:hypothetical protein